jgi:hypothetical protein
VSSAGEAESALDGCAPMEGSRLGALRNKDRVKGCVGGPMSSPADDVGRLESSSATRRVTL